MKKRFTLLVWLLAGLLFANFAYAQDLLNESFTDESFPPADWTVVEVNNPVNSTEIVVPMGWEHSSALQPRYDVVNPANFGDGAFAVFDGYNIVSGEQSMLITPEVTPTNDAYILAFDIMEVMLNQYNIKTGLKLFVEYSTDGESWTTSEENVLASIPGYNTTATSRTPVPYTLSLSDYIGETISIRFRAVSDRGAFALFLDNVRFNATSENPVFIGAEQVDFGTTYNIAPPYQKTYEIVNNGKANLTLSLASASQDITVTGLPATVGFLQKHTITVTFNPTGLSGNYNGQIVLSTNDADNDEVTVAVTSSVVNGVVSGYISEDFEDVSNRPANWTGTMSVMNSGGIGNSKRFTAGLMHMAPRQGWMQTNFIEMGSNPILSFYFRALNQVAYPQVEASPDVFGMYVYISDDYGSTWNSVYTMGPGEHERSLDYKLFDIDVSAYANQMVMLQVRFEISGNDLAVIYTDMDDLKFGTPPSKDLAAINLSGSNNIFEGESNRYTVTVKNAGSEAQSNYSVKLMREDGTELVSVAGTAIAPNEEKQFELDWVSDFRGITTIYGQVVLADDATPKNDKTSDFTVNILPQGTITQSIGDGNSSIQLPYNFTWNTSLIQSIYPAKEMGANGGTIEGIMYKTNFDAALTNKNIQIWIGETDKSNLSDDWVDPATMTKVFDGNLNFSNVSGADLTIMFDEPYNYNGGNIVIHSFKPYDGFFWNKNFIGTLHSAEARSRTLLVDGREIDPLDPAGSGNSSMNFTYPNITMLIGTNGMGMLEGIVTDGTDPVEGVQLQISGTEVASSTDAAGSYSFALTPGTYEIETSKFGFYDQTISNITIQENATKIQDIALTPIPQYTVKGKVIRSDNGEEIAGASISFTGYNSYTAVSDENGEYEIAGIYGNDEIVYNVRVTASDYEDYNNTLSVKNNMSNTNFSLNETPHPVVFLEASITESDEALITWEAPGTVRPAEFRHDSGSQGGFLGLQYGTNNSIMGSVFKANAEVEEVSWYTVDEEGSGGPHSTINVFIFDLTADGLPYNRVLYSAMNIPNTDNEWTTHVLPTPVSAPNGFMVAVSYNGFLGIGTTEPTDDYPFEFNTYFFSQTYYYGQFTAFENNSAAPINSVLMIRAAGNLFDAQKSTPAEFGPSEDTRALERYTVYRLLDGEEESEWTELDSTAATEYTDSDWDTLERGVYRYAVKVNYSYLTSEAKLSNALANDMTVPYTVNITTNTGAPVVGTVISLKNQNGDPEHAYTLTAEDSAVVFPAVRLGAYTIMALLPGFDAYIVSDIVIEEESSIDIQLIEAGLPVVSPLAEINEAGQAVVSWGEPVAAVAMEFRHDSGIKSGSLGFYAGYANSVMGSVHRVAAVVDEISWMTSGAIEEGGPHPFVNVFVLDLNILGMPTGNVLYSAMGVPNTDDAWTVHQLPHPVEAPNGFLLALSYSDGFLGLCTAEHTSEYPFEQNTHFIAENYATGIYSAVESQHQVVFMLRASGYLLNAGQSPAPHNANVMLPRSKQEPIPLLYVQTEPINMDAPVYHSTSISKAAMELNGYTVFRLANGENDESEWTELGTTANTNYTDNAWSSLDYGTYRYAVRANYTFVSSSARLTNMLAKDMEIKFAVKVATNSGNSPEGAAVVLTNQNGNAAYVYSATADEQGEVAFPSVWRGVYDLTVALDGYDDFNATGIQIAEESGYNAELRETIYTPFGLEIEHLSVLDARFSWNNPEPLKISYYQEPDYNDLNAVFEDLNLGYGTIFDLSDYPDAVITAIDFHHGSWGKSGIWNYQIHVADMDTRRRILVTDQLQTTGDDKWERGIALGNIEELGGKQVGIFMEPLSGENGDAYPCLSADKITVTPLYSYFDVNLNTFVGTIIQPTALFGEWLMDLWIMTTNGDHIKISNRRGSSPFASYTVYLDGEEKASGLQDAEYVFTELISGDYSAGVKAVYATGETEVVSLDFTKEGAYYVTFDVKDGAGSPIDDAVLAFNSQEQPAGAYQVIAEPGTYAYSLSKLNYNTVNGTVTVADQHITVEVVMTPVVGIDNVNASQLAAYPNPTTGKVRIRNSEAKIQRISVSDTMGRPLYEVVDINDYETTIDLTGFANGIYFIKVDDAVIKVIKQ